MEARRPGCTGEPACLALHVLARCVRDRHKAARVKCAGTVHWTVLDGAMPVRRVMRWHGAPARGVP
eukprot:10036513-Alexandrium_andersonii.AAC.1